MPTKKKIRPPRRDVAPTPLPPPPFRPEWADEVPGLTGTMKPAEAIALLDRSQRENDPEEDAAVSKALQEEFAEARRIP